MKEGFITPPAHVIFEAKKLFGAVGEIIDGANPFIIWGRYSRHFFRYYMNLSFQFHHTQMDGAHAGKFLANLQKTIDELKC